jgi:hypothetical protein
LLTLKAGDSAFYSNADTFFVFIIVFNKLSLFCQLSLSSLEKALHAYTLGPATQPFDIKAVPVAAVEEETRAKVSLTLLCTRWARPASHST